MAPEPDAEPPPEPWTPERVSEWNAYYDFYVKLAALLLVFMVSCNYVDGHAALAAFEDRAIDCRTRVAHHDRRFLLYGKRTAVARRCPGFSSGAMRRSTSWSMSLVPVNPTDPTANRATAEQIAIGTLVVFSALARLATAWLLLKIRHRGPGLWWSALVVTLALGVVFHPAYGLIRVGS